MSSKSYPQGRKLEEEIKKNLKMKAKKGVNSIFNNMKIFVKARLSAKKEKIEKISETNFVVWVKEPPIKGKANRAIVKAIAGYFNVAPSRVVLVAGSSSRQKIFEILL